MTRKIGGDDDPKTFLLKVIVLIIYFGVNPHMAQP